MGKLNGFIVVIATVFVLVNFGSGVIGDKIDAKIDIVTIITTPDETEIKKAYEKLPTYFEIGEKQAQLAIVSDVSGTGGGPGNVVINLVDDPNAYLQALKEWQVSKPKYGYSRIYAIDKIHWQVFVNRGDRAKAVVMIITFSLQDVQLTEMVMQLLDSGVWLYVIAKNEGSVVNEANDYTPDKKRLFIMSGNDVNFVDKMDGVKDAILDDLCNEWDKACRYTDDTRQKCEFHAWIKHINDPNQCSTNQPPTETCDNAGKCDEECDKRWPWENGTDCTDKCGISFNRITSIPPLKMEHCALEYWCPTCTTTTTTTTTTKEGESKDLTWLYALLAILALLILIIIIVVVVVMKKRAPANASAAKTASMKKQSIKSVSLGKQATVGSMAGKGAEASVGADLPSMAPSISQRPGGGKSSKPSEKGTKSIKDTPKSAGPSKNASKTAGLMKKK